MINVLHVMGRMAPGGTEHQLLGMLEAAHGRHWAASLCVLSTGWELTERARAAGVPVFELDGAGKADPRRGVALRRLAAGFDLVHASLPGASAVARLAAFGLKRPAIVVSERGVDDQRSVLSLLNRLLGPMTDAFIGNSPAVIEFIRAVSRIRTDDSRLALIPNGLDGEIFRVGGPSTPRSVRRLIAVGRLIPSKRFELAIGVLRRLRQDIDAELLIAGDGPERSRLETLARDLPVSFLGHVSNRHALADLLRSADVLLMTSNSEGHPNAVLEAVACGIAVVATDIPGNRAAAGAGVVLVGDGEEEWRGAVLDALAYGSVPSAQVADRVVTFDEVARRHLAVFDSALVRHSRRSARSRAELSPEHGP
ncbi:MAG: glycosyltransferase [Acidimicrobiia bacterium]